MSSDLKRDLRQLAHANQYGFAFCWPTASLGSWQLACGTASGPRVGAYAVLFQGIVALVHFVPYSWLYQTLLSMVLAGVLAIAFFVGIVLTGGSFVSLML